MRVSGIIRKIDELGRIVLPREYRRLLEIDCGDPMEIMAMENGEIVLKKVDSSQDLLGATEKILEVLRYRSGGNYLSCDNSKFVASSGELAQKKVGYSIDGDISSAIRGRKQVLIESVSLGSPALITPIIALSECRGAIIYIGAVNDSIRQDCELASLISARGLEKY